MQKIAIISPVPNMIESVIENSMIRKAINNGILDIHIVNPRDFSKGNYQQIDDTPFGGGPGMVMMAEPLFKAIDFLKPFMKMSKTNKPRVNVANAILSPER